MAKFQSNILAQRMSDYTCKNKSNCWYKLKLQRDMTTRRNMYYQRYLVVQGVDDGLAAW